MSPEFCNGWRIARYLDNALAGDELRWVSEPLPELGEGQLLLETCLLSLDASNSAAVPKRRAYCAWYTQTRSPIRPTRNR